MHVHPEAAALQPEPILKALLRNRVNCVIVGSFGAIAQGVDLEYTDIDLCIEMSAENIRATAAVLNELNAIEGTGDDIDDEGHSLIVAAIARDPAFIHTRETSWVFLTPYGEVDLVMKPEGFPRGYEDLTDKGASGVMYAQIEDIRRSKELAGRDKDLEALKKFPPPSVHRTVQPLPDTDELALRTRRSRRYRG